MTDPGTPPAAPTRRLLDDLLSRVAGGDSLAVEPLYRALWPIVVSYCNKVLDHLPDAEDAGQKALLKMFEQAEKYDPERSAVTWALALAYWETRTIKSSRRRRGEQGENLEVLANENAPPADEVLGETEWERIAQGLIAQLPTEDRALVSGDEQKLTQALLDLSPAARRKRRQRIIERLHAAFVEIVHPGRQR